VVKGSDKTGRKRETLKKTGVQRLGEKVGREHETHRAARVGEGAGPGRRNLQKKTIAKEEKAKRPKTQKKPGLTKINCVRTDHPLGKI